MSDRSAVDPEVGTVDDVSWITTGTAGVGRTIATAIPPSYEAYATVVIPDGHQAKAHADAVLLRILRARTTAQPWWLGYLDTGVSDVVRPEAPRVAMYVDWPYVVLRAGPDEAATWRTQDGALPWHSALPDLMFPKDRSWLASALWDDDWWCIGGSRPLVDDLVGHPDLDTREVAVDEDATPPGHDAI